MQSEEIDVLAQVASGLRIPAVIVELRIFEWREELAAKGRPVKRLASQVYCHVCNAYIQRDLDSSGAAQPPVLACFGYSTQFARQPCVKTHAGEVVLHRASLLSLHGHGNAAVPKLV